MSNNKTEEMAGLNEETGLGESSLPIALVAVPSTILLLTLVGNILVLIAFRRMRKLQLQHYFMIGLAVADLLTLIPYSQVLATLAMGNLTMDMEACYWFALATVISIAITTWLHSCLSIEKCLSVCRPFHHRRLSIHKNSKYIAFGIISCCYILPAILSVLVYVTNQLEFHFESYAPGCLGVHRPKDIIIVTLPFLLIPMSIQAITHLLIIVRVCKMRNPNSRKHIFGAMRTLALSLGLYYLSWSPFFILVVYWTFTQIYLPWWNFISIHLVFSYSCLPFFIYIATLPKFRARLKLNHNRVGS